MKSLTIQLNSFLQARSTIQIIFIGLILISLIGTLDFSTGNELSFSIFYLFPVALTSWYASQKAGLCLCVVAAITWYCVDSALRKLLPHSIPEVHEISKLIMEKFDVEHVIFIGDKKTRQPEKLFHLDQAMVFLGDGVVGISHIVGDYPEDESNFKLVSEAAVFLAELKNTMLSLGFHVHDIDITTDNLLHFEDYVNTIPYYDLNINQKTLLMPVFESQHEDESIVEKNVSTFESFGYRVVKVKAQYTMHKGGIHCLANVLE